MPTDVAMELGILEQLGLARVAIVDQLVLIVRRFRPAQQHVLQDALEALDADIRVALEAYFDRVLDVREQLESFLQDVVKVLNFLQQHHEIDHETAHAMVALVAALGDRSVRVFVLRLFQSFALKRMRMLCRVCSALPVKTRQEFCVLFLDDLPGLVALLQRLEDAAAQQDAAASLELAVVFVVKCCASRCLPTWLVLLQPVPPASFLALLQRLQDQSAVLLRSIAHFLDVTGLPLIRVLEWCPLLLAQLSVVLSEFAAATALTIIARFNTDAAMQQIMAALTRLGNVETARIIDALATEANSEAVSLFLETLVDHVRSADLTRLFLSFSPQTQLKFVALLWMGASRADKENEKPSLASAVVLGNLFLSAHFRSIEAVIHKLSVVQPDALRAVVVSMSEASSTDFADLGEGIELVEAPSIDIFLKLWDKLDPEYRRTMVECIRETPGSDAALVYRAMLHMLDAHSNARLAQVLTMLVELPKADKETLCTRVFHRVAANAATEVETSTVVEKILLYLCECVLSQSQMIKLLSSIDHTSFETLLSVFRTQRQPEQVALTKLMLRMNSDDNARLLATLQAWETDVVDEFFELLLVIPKTEVKAVAKLLVSKHLSAKQAESFFHLAANMANQASSREIITFTAALPVKSRAVFLEMINDHPEKGVIMRIVAYSARLEPSVVHALVEVLPRMSWETRSCLVEQVRMLEDPTDVDQYITLLAGLADNSTLARVVHLINMLQIPVRIALTPLLLCLTDPERPLVLAKLDEMPKASLASYCTSICIENKTVAAAFLRVMSRAQVSVLVDLSRLLQHEVGWSFVIMMAKAVETDALNEHGATLNGFAIVLTRLETEDEFELLQEAMEEALTHGTTFDEIVLVLVQFATRRRLTTFLRYVQAFAARSSSTALFRVLAKFHVTEALFQICRIADFDDAVFAIRRLDRLPGTSAEAVATRLESICRLANRIQAKDELFNLVQGFGDCSVRSETDTSPHEREFITPRSRSVPEDSPSAMESDMKPPWPTELTAAAIDDSVETPSRVLDADAPSLRHARMSSLAQATQRRRQWSKWREWTTRDWNSILGIPTASSSTDMRDTLFQANPTDAPQPARGQTPREEDDADVAIVECTAPLVEPPSPAALSQSFEPTRSSIALPRETASCAVTRSCVQLPPLTSAKPIDTKEMSHRRDSMGDALTRSESAPALQRVATVDRNKQYRGLTAALQLPPSLHVPRNCGAAIYARDCEAVQDAAPWRIRFSKTRMSQAKIMAARVDRALGKRASSSASPSATSCGAKMTSLQRRDHHTIERALQALDRAAECRNQRTSSWLTPLEDVDPTVDPLGVPHRQVGLS